MNKRFLRSCLCYYAILPPILLIEQLMQAFGVNVSSSGLLGFGNNVDILISAIILGPLAIILLHRLRQDNPFVLIALTVSISVIFIGLKGVLCGQQWEEGNLFYEGMIVSLSGGQCQMFALTDAIISIPKACFVVVFYAFLDGRFARFVFNRPDLPDDSF